MLHVTPPQQVITSLGSGDLLTYSEVMQYPLMQAAYEIADMLEDRAITSYAQLARRTDVTTMVIARVCEIDREARLADREVTVHNPHGRFFPLTDLVIGGLTRPWIEIQKADDPEAARLTKLSGEILRVTLGEFLDQDTLEDRVSLGLNIDADLRISDQKIPGYWFIPLGGNDFTITPPVALN